MRDNYFFEIEHYLKKKMSSYLYSYEKNFVLEGIFSTLILRYYYFLIKDQGSELNHV